MALIDKRYRTIAAASRLPPGKIGFLLQRFYVKEFAENLMMHLLVQDADAWWTEIQRKQIAEKYGVRVDAPENMPWNMRDLVLFDPSGVLWRISQGLTSQA